LRVSVVLALIVAGAGCALAAKLDKAACDNLRTELAGANAIGLKADMERGPEWAMVNLPPERLAAIRRMIEVQEQLEFRCGGRPGIIAKSRDDKAGAPGAKPENGKPVSTTANAAPGAPTTSAPAATGAAPAPGPNTPAAKSPVATDATMQAAVTPSAKIPPAAPIAPPVTLAAPPKPPATTATAAPPAIAPATKSAAAKKRSRRESSNAYVPPGDVNPLSLSPSGLR
jgi:hypothetical protein